MPDKIEAPVDPAPPAANSEFEDAAKKVKTTKRSDAVQTFVQNWLGQHALPREAFTAADAVELTKALDALDK
jgi:hypothetical protein